MSQNSFQVASSLVRPDIIHFFFLQRTVRGENLCDLTGTVCNFKVLVGSNGN